MFGAITVAGVEVLFRRPPADVREPLKNLRSPNSPL